MPVERRARPQRQEHAPQQQQAQQRVEAAADVEVAQLHRTGQQPRGAGRGRGAEADEQGEAGGGVEREQQALRHSRAAEQMDREAPLVQPGKELQDVGAGQDAGVGVVGAQRRGALRDVGEHAHAEADAHRSEGAKIDAEDGAGAARQGTHRFPAAVRTTSAISLLSSSTARLIASLRAVQLSSAGVS